MNEKTDDAVRADLRARLTRLAGGCTEEQADMLLDRILGGWGFRDCAQLAEVLPALAVSGLDRDVPLFWLCVTVRIVDEAPAGRALFALPAVRH